jgi:hypothetical protein
VDAVWGRALDEMTQDGRRKRVHVANADLCYQMDVGKGFLVGWEVPAHNRNSYRNSFGRHKSPCLRTRWRKQHPGGLKKIELPEI